MREGCRNAATPFALSLPLPTPPISCQDAHLQSIMPSSDRICTSNSTASSSPPPLLRSLPPLFFRAEREGLTLGGGGALFGGLGKSPLSAAALASSGNMSGLRKPTEPFLGIASSRPPKEGSRPGAGKGGSSGVFILAGGGSGDDESSSSSGGGSCSSRVSMSRAFRSACWERGSEREREREIERSRERD